MALRITRVKLWAASIEDKPGGLAEKLAALADAGANLEIVFARRAGEQPGTGVVFLAPLKGAAQLRAAKTAGFETIKRIHSVRVEVQDSPGLTAKITRKVGAAGINLRGFSATALNKRALIHMALDTAADAAKTVRVLRKL